MGNAFGNVSRTSSVMIPGNACGKARGSHMFFYSLMHDTWDEYLFYCHVLLQVMLMDLE